MKLHHMLTRFKQVGSLALVSLSLLTCTTPPASNPSVTSPNSVPGANVAAADEINVPLTLHRIPRRIKPYTLTLDVHHPQAKKDLKAFMRSRHVMMGGLVLGGAATPLTKDFGWHTDIMYPNHNTHNAMSFGSDIRILKTPWIGTLGEVLQKSDGPHWQRRVMFVESTEKNEHYELVGYVMNSGNPKKDSHQTYSPTGKVVSLEIKSEFLFQDRNYRYASAYESHKATLQNSDNKDKILKALKYFTSLEKEASEVAPLVIEVMKTYEFARLEAAHTLTYIGGAPASEVLPEIYSYLEALVPSKRTNSSESRTYSRLLRTFSLEAREAFQP